MTAEEYVHYLDCPEAAIVKVAELGKENAELSNSVLELTNTKTELENKVTELEKQIKKMECCGNCKYRIKKNLEGKIWVELCEKSYIKNKCEEWELVE